MEAFRSPLPLGVLLSLLIWISTAQTRPTAASTQRNSPDLIVPNYGASANGFRIPPRGWNSFGMQSLGPNADNSFILNQSSVQEQCDMMDASKGYTYCSIDSGWSGNGGDQFGRLVPAPEVFPNLKALGDHLHDNGKKLGVYVLPGALTEDQDVIVEDTNIRLGDLFDTSQPEYNLRRTFNFSLPGVQEWHNSVVNNFANIGVDLIKLDFLTPGSPEGGNLPANNSLAAVAYHEAIQQSGRDMRLDLSWKLERDEADWEIWRSSADSLRTDNDLNNLEEDTFTAFSTLQRAIDMYRGFIAEQTTTAREGIPIMIHPDMDNTFVGDGDLSGLTDQQRYTQMIHWIGAGANLITASDFNRIDDLGNELLYNDEALEAAGLTAQFPMQPRNPDSSNTPGEGNAAQLQAWIAGPDDSGSNAIVVLANYGPDLGQGGFGTDIQGTQLVTVSTSTLGISSDMQHGAAEWSVRRIWGGGGSGGEDHSDIGNIGDDKPLECNLGEGESVLYRLTRVA